MCQISLEDIPYVFEHGGRHCFFVNKLDLAVSYGALQCLHEYLTQT